MTDKQDGPYYAKGGTVWKHPVHNEKDDGTTVITIGFPVCKMHDAVGDDASTGLVIGEGVETCLAARQLGLGSVWALGSVGAIGRFPCLPGVKALTILGEAGMPSWVMARRCANRWGHQCPVTIIRPDYPLSDMNDVLQAGAGWQEIFLSEPGT